ncbi:MAG: hypothetical protein AAFU41_16585 [Pseudomonadota bacterium]
MKSLTKALAMAASLSAGTQAQALSCMRPDPISTFAFLAAESDPYFVIYGTLIFDEALLPTGVSNQQSQEPAPIPARFDGKGLSSEGFVNDYVSDMILQVTCAGPWCGTAQSGVEAVIFVASEQPITVEAGACGGRIFENPDQATLDALTTCMQGGPCSP